MSAAGVDLPTSLGQPNGVHRFRHNPRGTLNSSNSLFVRFNDVGSANTRFDGVVFDLG